jgi:hypothetical protein
MKFEDSKMHAPCDPSGLSDRELVQAYVEAVIAFHATENVAKQNRLSGYVFEIFNEMRARGRERPMLRELAQHANEDVRSSAASKLKWLENPPPPPSSPSPHPFRAESIWQIDHAPPTAMTYDEMRDQLKGALLKFGDRIMRLALPAIGLWPQRLRSDGVATGSRLGGMPLAPADWQWPMEDDEPLVFVAQINCSELHGLPGAEMLPSSGLLSFFAEHDGVMACRIEARRIAIHHWPHVGALVPAAPPIPPMLVPPFCPVVMRPVIDLPHPHSQAIAKLKLGDEHRARYATLWKALRNHGIPAGIDWYCGFSKLLGWPVLIKERDLDQFEYNHRIEKKIRLLLQIDHYKNGEESHGWGPGGSLYFALPEDDLLAHDYATCEFDIQFT